LKLLALFLLLTLVTPIVASDEPMRMGCYKHRAEAFFTGRVRDGGYECEFEHKQYPGTHKFFVPCREAERANEYILRGRSVRDYEKASLDIPGLFCPTHGRPLHLTGRSRLDGLYCEVSHLRNGVQHQMWYSCASVKPWSVLE
jgi:hypothetical protein